MALQDTMAADLYRRGQALTQEVDRMRARVTSPRDSPAAAGAAGSLLPDWMTLHQSQVQAVQAVLLDGLLAKHRETLAQVDPRVGALAFADAYDAAEATLLGALSILAVLRYAFDQRENRGDYATALDLADLIAADCYTPFILQVVTWAEQAGLALFTTNEQRPPPLTVLNARRSPAALTRNFQKFEQFNNLLEANKGTPLPISMISLPFADTAAVWRYCALYHEVGHALESDRDLSGYQYRLQHPGQPDNQSLRPILAQLPEPRQGLWGFWLREVIADAFGVLLGGAGFAYALTSLLYQPLRSVTEQNGSDNHPTPYVRIFLLAALLREMAVSSLLAVADEIEQFWQETYREADLPEGVRTGEQGLPCYRNDCATVAKLVLGQKLPALFGHCLRDFAAPSFDGINVVDPLEEDYRRAQELAGFLSSGKPADRPDPAHPTPFPFRLVPAAAQLAVQALAGTASTAGEADQASATIHAATLAYALGPQGITRPASLGGPSLTDANKEHLWRLVMNFDFHNPSE